MKDTNKIKLLDKKFQQLSNDKYCRFCGVPAQCSHHLIRRRNKITRWQPMNALYLCTECHNKVHSGLLDDRVFITPDLAEYKNIQYKEFLLFVGMSESEFLDYMINLYNKTLDSKYN